ncbi:class I adenylate-forming enzyme family protein [Ruegeria halocynthiae]|uniref:class I adenylate-forming enzyme family protein n=1 Tax=Ruegeria halocynthiae TaxID=985054 RepID=UPI00056110DA|nr:class I adenylate-forming enzyme family protein [Ruegeria halocynthiae]
MPVSGPPLDAPADLTDLFRKGLSANPKAPALFALDGTWTWQELDAACTRLARRYLSLGLIPGDRVASIMPNRTALVIHYLACMRAGLIAMPLNYRYTAADIDYALGLATPAALLMHSERAKDVAEVPGVARLPVGVITYAGEVDGAVLFEDLLDGEGEGALPTVRAEAPAFIFFTSGTTGKPKGVTHSHASMGYMVASNAQGLGLGPEDVVLPASWISHTAGLRLTFAGLWAGARTDIARRFTPDELLGLLRQTRPTVAQILPAPLTALVTGHGAVREDFGSLKTMMAGGDKPSQTLVDAFGALAGVPIGAFYGMTEMGTSHSNTHGDAAKVGAVGLNNPGYASALRDKTGAEVPIGVDGRHWVKSPTMMTGYWKDPGETAAAFRDGWLDTGDLMRQDEDGYFWFRGRRKQIIVHDGSNISPAEVEDALTAHPAVAAAVAVGVRDDMHGEDVWGFVSLVEGLPPVRAGEIIDFVRERIGYKAPDVVRVLGTLPLTMGGKLDRMALKQMAAEESGAAHVL